MALTRLTLAPGDVAEITAAAAAPTPTPAPTPAPVPAPVPATATQCVGLNLAAPWEGNIGARTKLFNDCALTGRFIDGDPTTGPSKFLFLTVSDGARGAKVAGQYTLRAATTGSVTCNAGAVVKLATDVWQVTVGSDTDAVLSFSAPVTIRAIWRPGADETKTCSKEFLAFIKPFGFIRFMDLMGTNWADDADAVERRKSLGPDGLMQWTERPSDTDRFNRPWGISVEAAIRTCNESGKDMWLCLPHVSSNQLFTAIGSELAAKLDPALNVYIEFSNETWNYGGGFEHSNLVKDAAAAYIAAGTLPKLNDNEPNPYYLAQRYTLLRLHDAWAAMKSALGARVRPIYASQFNGDYGGIEAAAGYFASTLMWGKRTWGNNDWLYGLACAPYIGASQGTVEEILAALTADYKTRQVPGSKLANMRALCDAHLKNNNLFFYEVGIDMGQSDTNLANRCAAAYAPGMRLVTDGFVRTNIVDKGVAGAAWFNGCSARNKWGPAWGATDDASDLSQPILAALANAAQLTRPTSGVTAEFFAKTDFTVPLEKKVTPLIDHAWVSWRTAPLHHGQNPQWNEGKDGSIRFTFRYTGTAPLQAVCEANDSATLTKLADGTHRLDYVARFAGNGACYVQLQEQVNGAWQVVATGKLLPQ